MARRRASARSIAARKGWATRRARAAARSAAAKRGWQTRKTNERRAARKAAQQKAARTRRARERTREAPARGEEIENIRSLDRFIELFDDAEYYDDWDIETSPDYSDE